MKCFNIAFFASHGGSNMQAVLESVNQGRLCSKPALLISNNSESGAIQKAKKYGLPYFHISSLTHPIENERTALIISLLEKYEIDLICLAGYMKLLPKEVIDKVNGQVLNIHPALLPAFGGNGMYGMKVHEAVINSKEKTSGATIHAVNNEYDKGKILLKESVEVSEYDTPQSLADKILTVEHIIYSKAIRMLEQEIISF